MKNKATNEYECAHCDSTFRFLDPTQKTVLRGTIAHNCPSCGAPVKDGEGLFALNAEKIGYAKDVQENLNRDTFVLIA